MVDRDLVWPGLWKTPYFLHSVQLMRAWHLRTPGTTHHPAGNAGDNVYFLSHFAEENSEAGPGQAISKVQRRDGNPVAYPRSLWNSLCLPTAPRSPGVVLGC